VIAQDPPCLPQAVVDEHVSRDRIGPPPPKFRVENQSEQHSDRENAVNRRDTTFSYQHRIVKGASSSSLARSKQEHRRRGNGRPDNSKWAVVRIIPDSENERRLDAQ
jgi:outer membrane receptor for ferrienterochelin and colicin